ncbi:uncharacterized protein LOC106181576 [Lingula anatina]|uniref:Uncharacterized protein LOC106181576 n=1 Tax=Lingula anatina TaxID=7574 RepID=A0A1S3KGV7_LINAN|nr:uncharacterized protein LOC106181576 [Lingula anatina]XP_013421456.1 uncharacterized protein LOC106181576 [Lingula anatina]XP_013421457.1 uncharacterized protein LOC106181576 [Lingula anatina]XP_013421458.1 uncharacterized protein LOC106181576 [Lingula anatina]XP_013421459.1 uncharacterized protein LOC106181576 [Lingula anatina]XP_013421460.1 uncharacterized protein LOC106181576 [Lingula anatina]XP_013421461.1 uncharacterized protein LOC106181576 [Lingula anatina]XP_013421462.1 uncharacte|eukprot:XP_013421455.1 uncharacterized protein LOC106181576 [Lingula anatina]
MELLTMYMLTASVVCTTGLDTSLGDDKQTSPEPLSRPFSEWFQDTRTARSFLKTGFPRPASRYKRNLQEECKEGCSDEEFKEVGIHGEFVCEYMRRLVCSRRKCNSDVCAYAPGRKDCSHSNRLKINCAAGQQGSSNLDNEPQKHYQLVIIIGIPATLSLVIICVVGTLLWRYRKRYNLADDTQRRRQENCDTEDQEALKFKSSYYDDQQPPPSYSEVTRQLQPSAPILEDYEI